MGEDSDGSVSVGDEKAVGEDEICVKTVIIISGDEEKDGSAKPEGGDGSASADKDKDGSASADKGKDTSAGT